MCGLHMKLQLFDWETIVSPVPGSVCVFTAVKHTLSLPNTNIHTQTYKHSHIVHVGPTVNKAGDSSKT